MSAITFEELSSKLKEFLVVDVRTRDEVRDNGQIPHSHVLPVQELDEALALSPDAFQSKYGFPKPDPNNEGKQPLVLTCRSGRRVGVADNTIKTKGFTKHRLYMGSFLDWTEKGGQVIKPGQPFQPQQ
ncbi:hypothetical protein Pmani_008164 [Petrolisthes manimaculis]|uniref:Rhodanese domain-containing protein n=1 Tax=Petrolisthes manimaculis TaxID=1843537 RepID=A0AAE1Q9E3_9EUCA|nr:hypothetical protein Pmani_008164 [Petrolisthes manimaculis]